MNEEDKKRLTKDPDGLLTYEYIANHINNCFDDMDFLLDNMKQVDRTGQFLASTARYLTAIDPQLYRPYISAFIAATIDRDREHRYLADLLQGIWGDDYAEKAPQLAATDDNFRRIHKRLFPSGII